MIVLLIIIVPILGIKTYFEINNTLYENQIEKLNINVDHVESNVEHKTLLMDGYDIHYFVSGKEHDDLIVLLHPAYSDHRAFNQQIDYFSKNHCVIAIDLIGHGLSKANKSTDKIDASSKHIEKILEIEGFDKAHLVGVSIGSLIAQYFALNHPDKIKSLTALSGYDINKKGNFIKMAKSSFNPGFVFRIIFSIKSFRKMAAEITCKTEKGQALFYEAGSYYERKSFMVMPGLKKIITDRENTKPQYPTLILTGEFDMDIEKEMSKEWHLEIDDSEYFMFENAGHCANIDKPAEFNEYVEDFIRKVNKK